MSALTPIGIGSTAVGLGLSAVGNYQGAHAMGDVAKAQRAAQAAVNAESAAAMQKRIDGIDVAGGFNDAQGRMNNKAAALAAQMQNQNPNGGPVNGSAIDTVVARGNGGAAGLYDSQYARMLNESANEQNNLTEKSQRLERLYDSQMRTAATKGAGFRNAGGILTAVGPGLATMGMFDGVGEAAATAAPAAATNTLITDSPMEPPAPVSNPYRPGVPVMPEYKTPAYSGNNGLLFDSRIRPNTRFYAP